MSHAVSLVNAFAASWADTFARACWQGGLGIVLVWLLCRLWPALPAGPRCWLWRLAYAKLLLGLVWLPPLTLPLLPAPQPPAAPPVAQAAALPILVPPPAVPPVQALPDDAPLLAAEPAPLSAAPPAPLTAPPPAPLSPLAATPPLPPRPTLPTVQAWLLAVWLLGVFASLGRVGSAWRRACALPRAGRPLADATLQTDADDLSQRLGLCRVPPLHVADGLASPLLLGLGRPTILLPAFVVSGSPRPDLRLMLAHELAHLARRDLWWNALPLLAQRLFFFHPLVWLAGHEWALAQEIACDALAVQTTGTPPSAYGRMLLGIATRRRPPAAPLFPTLAVAAPRHTLRRRLHAMQHIGTLSRPRLILAAALTALLAVGGLLPWRVVAQSGASVSSALPAAMRAEEARQVKERADYAAWEAQADAQFAEALRHVPPARWKEAQARIADMDEYVAKSQKHTRMMEQHRADYIATHPYRLSNAQRNDITRLLDLNVRRNGLNQSVAMGRILRVKLLADVAADRDAASRKNYQAQIERDDSRRRAAEQEMRLLEPRIARQKAVVALIPEDQRTLIDKLRHYDIDVSCGRIEVLTIKRSRVQVLQQVLATKPPRQHQDTATKASFAPPQAKTASFNAVAIGGPPLLRLAQLVSPPSVPPGVAYTEAHWEETERKQQADLEARNAQADAQLAEIEKQASPAQLKAVKSQIAFANAEYAKEQKRVQISEQSRAAYIASHPNRLSDAQIAFVQKVNWEKMHPSRIDGGIRWEQAIERKLRVHLETAHDARSRQGWQRQIAAIEQRRREGEKQMRELAPVIARQQARLASVPKNQRDRVAKLRSYDLEISGGRIIALTEKQVWVQVLRQRLAGKGGWPGQARHDLMRSFNIPAVGAAPSPHDAQSVRGGTEVTQPNHPTSAPVRVSPVMAEALGKQIAQLEKKQRVDSLNTHPNGVAAEGTVIAFLKARRAGAAWAQDSIASRQFSRGLTGQQIANLRRTEQEAQQNEAVAEKYAFLLAVKLTAQENLRRLALLQNQQFRRTKKNAAPHALPSSHTANLYFLAPKGQKVRVFTRDAAGQHLHFILDKVSDGEVIVSPPVPVTRGNKAAFFMYDNGQLLKAEMPKLEWRRVSTPKAK